LGGEIFSIIFGFSIRGAVRFARKLQFWEVVGLGLDLLKFNVLGFLVVGGCKFGGNLNFEG
jgi:hypothetical protein